jgi:outer membrane protein
MRKVLLAICFWSISLGVVKAQDQKVYTLQECVNIALENNLRVKRSLYGVQSSETFLLQSKAAFLPTLNAGGSYGQNY